MKHYIKACLLCFLFLFCSTLYAAALPIGSLTKSSLVVDVNNAQIETYNIFGTNYISVSKLREAGFKVTYSGNHEPLFIKAPLPLKEIKDLTQADLSGKYYSLYTGDVYIGHLKTQAISCNGKILVPVGTLNELFDSTMTENYYMLTPKKEAPVMALQTSIKNYSDQTINVSINDLYWNNGIIQKTLYFTLGPNEVIERQPSSDKKYLTSIVATAVYPGVCYKNTTLCGQNNTELLLRNDFAATLPDDIGDKTDIDTLYLADKTVNAKQLTSKTKYLVWTNLDKQKTFIFIMKNGRWSLVKHFICSSGKPSSPTPPGIYQLTKKVASFGQEHGYCCKNAFGFIGTSYLFHSILFDKTGTHLLEGRGVLGKKASDGCIRLSPENSLWFYNNLLPGSTVWIS